MKKNPIYNWEKTYFLLDNLSSHKTTLLLKFIYENNIHVIFNAIESPDFNPIEMAFNMIKKIIYCDIYEEKFVNIKILLIFITLKFYRHKFFEKIIQTLKGIPEIKFLRIYSKTLDFLEEAIKFLNFSEKNLKPFTDLLI